LNTGIEALDRMLGGGVIEGSTTAILGTPGIGKTLLNLQFLGEGAAQGETGMHVTFHETGDVLMSISERLELSFGNGLSSGRLHVKWDRALERSPDGWAWSVLEAVDDIRPTRLTIDAFSDVGRMFSDPHRQTSFGVAFSNELRNRGITTLVNLELDSLVLQTVDSPMPPITPMIDSGLLMRSVELDSSVRRMISVTKHRQSWFDATIREFTIGPGGIRIGGSFDGSNGMPKSADHIVKSVVAD
jgi:circadian clock protein KaiC